MLPDAREHSLPLSLSLSLCGSLCLYVCLSVCLSLHFCIYRPSSLPMREEVDGDRTREFHLVQEAVCNQGEICRREANSEQRGEEETRLEGGVGTG